ncbi:hypothetical protein E2C01_064995 [Portunus trituberculatus]|uniref:Uncharacterized protein n=1 Tax=Portunus trituberculatus TaxID=210409 RepID=A0A5B7HLU7_PORTR|nr:hypothetical protein [Portunus trituberculatus]
MCNASKLLTPRTPGSFNYTKSKDLKRISAQMSVKNEEDGLGTGGLIDRAEILSQLWSITHWRLHGPQLERPVLPWRGRDSPTPARRPHLCLSTAALKRRGRLSCHEPASSTYASRCLLPPYDPLSEGTEASWLIHALYIITVVRAR